MKTGEFMRVQDIEQKEWVNKEDFYEEDARILLVEDDELTSGESGFMKGYDDESFEEEL